MQRKVKAPMLKGIWIQLLVLWVVGIVPTACTIFKKPEQTVSISGKISIDMPGRTPEMPIFITVLREQDLAAIQNLDDHNIKPLAFISVDPKTLEYQYSFPAGTVGQQESVSFVAFVKNKFSAAIVPKPSAGDYIGFYLDQNSYSSSRRLLPGANKGIDISINKRMFDFKKKVSGVVRGDYHGPVLIAATNADLTSSKLTNLDPSKIVGFTKIDKRAAEEPFVINILPFGQNLPIHGVAFVAIYDANGNGKADPGEVVGSYCEKGDGKPTFLTVAADTDLSHLVIEPIQTIAAPAATPALLKGHLVLPKDYHADQGALFVVIMNPSKNPGISDFNQRDVRYFQRLDSNTTDFNINLKGTDLASGEQVMVLAVWEKKYQSGLPNISTGDSVGFFFDPQSNQALYTLEESPSNQIEIAINRHIVDEHRSIKGRLTFPNTGKITVAAYAGSMSGMDFSNFDNSAIVGFTSVTKDGPTADYQINLLPAVSEQISAVNKVYVIAFIDSNQNGKPDAGDLVGLYTDRSDLVPVKVTLADPTTDGIEIGSLSFQIPSPGTRSIVIDGKIAVAPDCRSAGTGQLFLAVTKGGLSANSLTIAPSDVLYFTKLSSDTFHIDISGFGVLPGALASVVAICSHDASADFPTIANGDFIGFYFDRSTGSQALALHDGLNDQLNVTVMREYHTYDQKMSLNVTNDYQGNLLLFAMRGESLSGSMDMSTMNPDDVIAFGSVSKGQYSQDFEVSLLPFKLNLPLSNIVVGALCDANGNGKFDPGEKIGLVTQDSSGMPQLLTIGDSPSSTRLNIDSFFPIARPSGATIYMSGKIDLSPLNYDGSGKVYLVVADSEAIQNGFQLNSSSIYYYGLVKDPARFAVNLSNSSIVPGQSVAIMAVWDRDGSSALPRLKAGDGVGLYIPTSDQFGVKYQVQSGENKNINIVVNKRYQQHSVNIPVRIEDDYRGRVTLVAIRGEALQTGLSGISMDSVIAFKTVEKTQNVLSVDLQLIPFEIPLPQENILVVALYDGNRNGQQDPGERFGLVSSQGGSSGGKAGGRPQLITVAENQPVAEQVIDLWQTTPTPSGQYISVSGSLIMPSGLDSGSTFVLVVDGKQDISSLQLSLTDVKAFYRVPRGSSSYNIDLSNSSLKPGDAVTIMAVQSVANATLFPDLKKGDWVGIYGLAHSSNISAAYVLGAGQNRGLDITIDRRYTPSNTKIKGNLLGSYAGVSYVIAYRGTLVGMNFSSGFDVKDVIGFAKVNKQAGSFPFEMQLLPLDLEDSVQNHVSLFAIYDVNGDGAPGPGDMVAFYTDSDGYPARLAIPTGGVQDLNFRPLATIPVPGNSGIYLRGQVTPPVEYQGNSKGLFIAVLKSGGNLANFGSNFFGSIKKFQALPAGETKFDLSLDDTDLKVGDQVMVVAIWDKNYDGDLPRLHSGTAVGVLQSTSNPNVNWTLVSGDNRLETNSQWRFEMSLQKVDHSASITVGMRDLDGGNLKEGDHVTLVAIQKDGVDLTHRTIKNLDYAVGFGTVTYSKLGGNANLSISPVLLPSLINPNGLSGNFINNVMILAIADKNNNGVIDSADPTGLYFDLGSLSSTIDLVNGSNEPRGSVVFSKYLSSLL